MRSPVSLPGSSPSGFIRPGRHTAPPAMVEARHRIKRFQCRIANRAYQDKELSRLFDNLLYCAPSPFRWQIAKETQLRLRRSPECWTAASAVVGRREDVRHRSTAGAALPHSCIVSPNSPAQRFETSARGRQRTGGELIHNHHACSASKFVLVGWSRREARQRF